MRTLKTISEIKKAIDNGEKVMADEGTYLVYKDKEEGKYRMKSTMKGSYYIKGLHGRVGTVYEKELNGEHFYSLGIKHVLQQLL